MILYDNTRISTHQGCPRRFLFRHILDWTGEGMAHAPGFGIAWHTAMDTVWAKAKEATDPIELAKEGYASFCESWREQGFPDPLDDDPAVWKPFKQRTPDTAAAMLLEYIRKRVAWIRSVEIIAIEQPFIVPLFHDKMEYMYCGRLDKVIRRRGKIHIVDHKTTSAYSKTMGLQENFTESFIPNNQIEGYAYAGHLLYPDEFKGIYIDASLVWKTRQDIHELIPVETKMEQLDGWLAETREKVMHIEDQKLKLKEFRMQDEMPNYLHLFPKYTNACWDWNQPCTYLDVCRVNPNPFKAYARPDHLIEDRWSPFEHAQLAKLGIKEDDVEDS